MPIAYVLEEKCRPAITFSGFKAFDITFLLRIFHKNDGPHQELSNLPLHWITDVNAFKSITNLRIRI